MLRYLKRTCLITGISFGLVFFAKAQTSNNTPSLRTCLSDQIHQEKMEHDPQYRKHYLEKQERFKKAITQNLYNLNVLCPSPVVLPVAVHFQNISSPNIACLRTLAENQVQILNDDIQGLNSDITNWSGSASGFFPGVSNGETCLEFCIATQNHPAGFGISNGDPAVTVNQFSNDFNSSWSGYINIFVRNISALGYSPLGGDGDGDGVTIDISAFGSGAGCSGVVPGSPYHLGRTLTHEIGHYLNLGHIWGGGCGNDDGVGDTPNSSSPWYGCPALGEMTCGSNDMHMNYMDYTNDACMYMFSAGQSTVMENYTSSNLGGVSGNSSVCLPPAPTIQFANAGTTITEGTSNCNTAGTKTFEVTLNIAIPPSAPADVILFKTGSATEAKDYDINPPSVTFPAGQSADQTVTITVYEDAEVEVDENVMLSYSINPNGGDAVAGLINQTHTIDIMNDDNPPSTSALVTVIAQDFNNGLGNWTVNDGGSNTATWDLSTGRNGANNDIDGTQFIIADSDAAGNGSTMNEELLSPVFDGAAVTGLTLEFDQYINIYNTPGDFFETFDVDIWNGSSWQNVFHWDEGDEDIGDWGMPDPQTIDISAHAHSNNQLRFVYVAEYDWWWALDNIEVTGTSQQGIQTAANSSSGFVEHEFGPMSTIHFYDENTNNVMMTLVNNSSHNYGCTRVEVDRGAGNPPGATLCSAPESEYATDKTFRVIPEFNNPSGDYTISLYYTDDEITGWATGSGRPIVELEMIKSSTSISSASTVELIPVTITSFGSDHIYTANVTTGFSGFALGNPANPLPVELLEIKASLLEQSILISWITVSEKNNKGFELLRSTSPEIGFERIAWIDGMGNTVSSQDYNFIDKQVVPGILYYYRLKQIDYDGTATLSTIVSAKTTDKKVYVGFQPNPVIDILNITFNTSLQGTISIFQSSGKLISNYSINGQDQLYLDMTAFSKGVYWIVVQTEKDRIVNKVIKR